MKKKIEGDGIHGVGDLGRLIDGLAGEGLLLHSVLLHHGVLLQSTAGVDGLAGGLTGGMLVPVGELVKKSRHFDEELKR